MEINSKKGTLRFVSKFSEDKLFVYILHNNIRIKLEGYEEKIDRNTFPTKF